MNGPGHSKVCLRWTRNPLDRGNERDGHFAPSANAFDQVVLVTEHRSVAASVCIKLSSFDAIRSSLFKSRNASPE